MLNWYWSEHLGTARRTDREGRPYYTDLYKGNALLIEIYTNPETDCYSLHSFWCDEQHAKNCLKDQLKIWEGARVILVESQLMESYSKAQARKLVEYLLKSGASVELI